MILAGLKTYERSLSLRSQGSAALFNTVRISSSGRPALSGQTRAASKAMVRTRDHD